MVPLLGNKNTCGTRPAHWTLKVVLKLSTVVHFPFSANYSLNKIF